MDYDAGNLRSVTRAVEHAGARPVVTADPAEIARADAVILPGVGAAADTMTNLRARGLVEPVRDYIASGRPFLGVCMGLQALLSGSEEGGWHECLGVVPGRVRKIAGDLKVPHMGWNQVVRRREHPVFAGIPDGANFYFVHSYVCEAAPEDTVGRTEHGGSFTAAVARDALFATQFHPEKSGPPGLELYRAFAGWAA